MQRAGGRGATISGTGGAFGDGQPEGFGNEVGVEFAVAREGAVEASVYGVKAGIAFQQFFHDGVAFFEHHDFLAFAQELFHLFARQGVLADFDDRVGAFAAEDFHEVVVADAAGDDAEGFVGAVDVLVVGGIVRML